MSQGLGDQMFVIVDEREIVKSGYPTMRPFRCGDGDDWSALFTEIAEEIRRKFAV
jgi:hypothetical protein